jgi:plasmid stability protein
MASIVIRNLDQGLKARLRVRAAHNGRSMEAEVREILGAELGWKPRPRVGAPAAIKPQFVEVAVSQLEKQEMETVREPPEFD